MSEPLPVSSAPMVDRSQPLVATPQACPFVALDGDRDQRLPVPDPMHRCFAEATAKARSMGHQASFCLTSAFTGCPIFLDWASRVAADVVETVPAATGASATAVVAASASATAGSATAGSSSVTAGSASSATPTRSDQGQRSPGASPAWVAEAMPPPPGSMEAPMRRTARVVIDAGPDPALGAGLAPPTDATVIAAVALTSLDPGPSTRAAGSPATAERASIDPDDDAAAELAASMARTDLMVDAGEGSAAEPRASTATDDEGTNSPPWSRGRPRVPMDAGAPSSLGPQTRPGTPPPGPREWEGARRFEAYAARTGSRRPGRPVLIAIGSVLVAVTLLAAFLLPSMFRGGAAAPTTSPTTSGSGAVGTAHPRATPTAPGATPQGPAPTPGSYRIKRGDTLLSIGRRFNVTVVQLTCANDIRNPNSLSVGATLIIPVESYQCPRPTKKPQKTPKN